MRSSRGAVRELAGISRRDDDAGDHGFERREPLERRVNRDSDVDTFICLQREGEARSAEQSLLTACNL